MSLWAFRFVLFYILILLIQPQNRFPVLWPFRIANLAMIIALVLHIMASAQEGVRIIRWGPATILGVLLSVAGILSLNFGPWQTSNAWNADIELILKSSAVMIMVEATCFTVQRVWAVQATILLGTMWWIKGGFRLATAGATYAGDRIMGPAVSLIENPNGFAYLLTVMLPIYLYFYQQSKTAVLRYGFLAVALVAVYIILQTGSRTGVVALAAVALFLVPKYASKYKLAFAVIGLAAFFIVGAISPGNIERFRTIPQSAKAFFAGVDESADTSKMTMDEQSAWERKMKNKHTWALIKEYPLFGVGIHPDMAAHINWERHGFAWGHVHNEMLFAGRQMGVIGIGLHVALLLTIAVQGYRSQRDGAGWWPALEDLGWTFKVQALVILVGGFFSPIPWNPLFLILVGSASALEYNVRHRSLDLTTVKM